MIMIFRQTQGVIGQHFQNAAIAGLATAALIEHALQLLSNGLQTRQSLVDFVQLLLHDSINRFATGRGSVSQTEQLPNGIECESEFARMSDETQTPNRSLVESSLAPFAAANGRDEADLFVVTYRRDLGVGQFPQLADRIFHFIFIPRLEALVTRDPMMLLSRLKEAEHVYIAPGASSVERKRARQSMLFFADS